MSAQTRTVRAASAPASVRAGFIKQVYLYVALAILVFAAVEALLLQWPGARDFAGVMTEGYNWLLVIVVFGIVTSFADRWARTTASAGKVYAGFALFILAEAVLFLPLLLGISGQADDVLPTAGVITLLMVAGLTAVVVFTGTDFSFLRGALIVGGFLALGLIVASIIFGFGLGLLFAMAMVAFASGSILYNTSNILKTYRTDQPVAAALSLFASIALLFWYVLSIVSRQRR
ncbi:MAG: Bax inhibitor-1 family protein [Chloroflexia bacterium]|nr:Bax inhibitor-1 family protein [Chloroflexia bacterium]